MRLIFFFGLVACGGKIGTNSIDTAVEEPSEEPLPDRDGDGVLDALDACPDDPLQWSDVDGDGHCDESDDACPDLSSDWIDSDGDGYCDSEDACPENENSWLDSDGDGHCNEEDACPDDPNSWLDSDGDGYCDEEDDCPNDPNGILDSNGDGLCDENDDSDGDGLSDGEEINYGSDCAKSAYDNPDTDEDGILDSEDPFPRDPWAEYILYRNENGTIDLMLSNRDGTFQSPIEIGIPYGDTQNTNYRYQSFVISDFDGNGRMDFLAVGDDDPEDSSNPYDVWWFWREKADEFNQMYLGEWTKIPFKTVGDFNNDERIDLVGSEIDKPSNITGVTVRFYENQGTIHLGNCFATEDPANPQNCAFVAKEGVNLDSWIANQWIYQQGGTGVDVDGDGNRDIAALKISSGGNSPTPLTVLYGNGDGTFDSPPSAPLLSHNQGACGNSPSNVLLFADFNMDNIGDIITGLDDDGDAGSAWFYPGERQNNIYTISGAGCMESFDINPNAESGSDNYGNTAAAIQFDFDFDGIEDIMVGYNDVTPWSAPSRTELLFGVGDGTFEAPVLIRQFPNSTIGKRFAVPQMLCPRFP